MEEKAIIRSFWTLWVLAIFGTALNSQNSLSANNFTIMVLPFTTDKDQSKIFSMMEASEYQRAAISEIREQLNQQGLQTLDFFYYYEKAKRDRIITDAMDAQVLKAKLLEYSSPDIFVEVEPILDKTEGGDKVRMIMNAFHTSSAVSLAIVQCECGRRFYEIKPVKLTQKAAECCMPEFMLSYKNGLEQLNREGQQVKVHFKIENSTDGWGLNSLDVKTPSGDEMPINYAIEEWIETNAMHYQLKTSTESTIILDQVRLPMQTKDGNYFNVNSFRRKLFLYTRKLLKTQPKNISVKENTLGKTLFFIFEENP